MDCNRVTQVFTRKLARYALYIALVSLTIPGIVEAGGLDKHIKPDTFGRADGTLRPPASTDSQKNSRHQIEKSREPRPSFEAPHANGRETDHPNRQKRQSDNKTTISPPAGAPAPDRDIRSGLPTPSYSDPSSDREDPSDRIDPIDHTDPSDRIAPNDRTDPSDRATRSNQVVADIKTIKKTIQNNNKRGFSTGHIKLYAKQNGWGSGVRIQACYGDNILTKFTVRDKGETQGLQFQYQGVHDKKSRTKSGKWVIAKPGNLIKGRYIYLRARSLGKGDIITLRVVGICIDYPQL